MYRWTRGLTRLVPNSSESNSPFVLFSSLYTKTRFHRSNQIKVDKLKPLAAAFPILHLTYTQQNPSSPRRTGTAMDSASASASRANDDFVHVEVEVVRSDSSHSDESESVVDEGVNNDNNGENNDDDGAGGIGASVYERKELPEELAQRVMMLTCESTAEGGVCDVYVVGTAHVSTESCQDVQAVISFLKPQVVFLELCSSRVAVLTPQNLKVPTMGEMVEMWKSKQNLFGIIYSWFLAKVASKLEVLPGAEFRVGFDEAMKYGGKVILGDRPVHITLRRTWAKLPLWHKTKILTSLVFQAFSLPSPETLNKMMKDLDDVDMLTLVIQEMSKQYPTLMETLVHERDKYMSSTLFRVASEHNSVVAVIGKGHLAGIRKHWKEPIEIMDLLEMPSQKPGIPVRRILKSLGVAVAGVAIVSGIYLSSKK